MEAESTSPRRRLSKYEPVAWFALLGLLTCAVVALFLEFVSHAGTISRSAALQAESSVRQAAAAEALNGTHERVAALNETLADLAHASKGSSTWVGPRATHTVETPLPDLTLDELDEALARHEHIVEAWQRRAPPQ